MPQSSLANDAHLSLEQFKMEAEIGRGQFSVVHRAIFTQTRQLVAIKRIQLFEMVDWKARADCIQEARLLKVSFSIL